MVEAGSGKSWEDVLAICSSLILFKTRAEANGWRDAFENMPIYLDRVGLGEDIQRMRIIHVAGTKGKGSTSAMVESMLRRCGYRTALFTSPHLIDVRERVRINGELVSKEVFMFHFWDCYERLHAAATPEIGVPGYFRFMTLLALKIFLAEKADVVVLEVGIGGRLDATNVVPPPAALQKVANEKVVSGTVASRKVASGKVASRKVASGKKIAGEKGGILKAGSPGFTVPQLEEGMQALQRCALKAGTSLEVVQSVDRLVTIKGVTPKVALGGSHQRMNAGLAVKLASAWESSYLKHLEGSSGVEADNGRETEGLEGVGGREGGGKLGGEGGGIEAERGCETEGREQGGGGKGAEKRGEKALVEAVKRRLIMLKLGVLPPDDSSGNDQGAATNSTSVALSLLGAPSRRISESSLFGSNAGGPPSRLTYFIDGAHSPESMEACAEWFAQTSNSEASGVDPSLLHRVLLFNCMRERDPAVLLPGLAARLATHGVAISNAFFVPPVSQYGFLASSTSSTASQQQQQQQPRPAVDLSWQQHMQGVWQSQCKPLMKGVQQGSPPPGMGLPPLRCILPLLQSQHPTLGESMSAQDSSQGAVLSTLSSTLDYLRLCVRESPQVRIQVLVTGSLYVVGDMLRLLGKIPK
eukprot:gene29259-12502_t